MAFTNEKMILPFSNFLVYYWLFMKFRFEYNFNLLSLFFSTFWYSCNQISSYLNLCNQVLPSMIFKNTIKLLTWHHTNMAQNGPMVLVWCQISSTSSKHKQEYCEFTTMHSNYQGLFFKKKKSDPIKQKVFWILKF